MTFKEAAAMASANCDPTPTLEHMTVVEAQSPTNWWTQELDNFQAISEQRLYEKRHTQHCQGYHQQHDEANC